MLRKTTHVSLRALLSGLLLAACGGVPEAGLAPAAEPLGTAEAAMCSGISVTSLTLSGISTYQGEMAGNGGWAVSPGANAVRLEYYVDGALRSTEERFGTYNSSTNTYQGTWYFSTTGIACGSRGFVVKAVPMIIDSMGNRTTCSDSPRSLSQTVTEPCPTPAVSLHFCYRYPDPYTASTVRCDASASGGSGTYNVFWRKNSTGAWVQGQWTQFFDCAYPSNPPPYNSYLAQTQFQVKVIDSAGRESAIQTSSTFSCEIRW
ncbi:hypothetical protein [Archangium sp.]|uniref:hypothetical protein n=1 Tax=Archangium sp. TaxID=1872627 RepID=UPI002D6655D2|nr:hypothetical protein [Archangium sp.]HYO58482.1 hypothetical protein [Archangium sp.]